MSLELSLDSVSSILGAESDISSEHEKSCFRVGLDLDIIVILMPTKFVHDYFLILSRACAAPQHLLLFLNKLAEYGLETSELTISINHHSYQSRRLHRPVSAPLRRLLIEALYIIPQNPLAHDSKRHWIAIVRPDLDRRSVVRH